MASECHHPTKALKYVSIIPKKKYLKNYKFTRCVISDYFKGKVTIGNRKQYIFRIVMEMTSESWS